MIWYEEILNIANTPPGIVIKLVGIYTPPDRSNAPHPILIRLEFSPLQENDTMLLVVLYSHNPSGLGYEDPNSDNILARYHSQVARVRAKIVSLSYDEMIEKYDKV